MLVKEFKQELNKFSDETHDILGFGFIVHLFKVNKEDSKNGK